MEQDELLARRLAEEYENTGTYEARTSNRDYRPQRRAQTGLRPDELHDDREHSFLDDDLPVIRENLRKGFIETQNKVNSWITSIKKKVDEAFDEDEETRQSNLAYGRRPGEPSRRSGDYDRYDADPQVITDDFAGMKLGSDGSMCPSSIIFNRPMEYKLTATTQLPSGTIARWPTQTFTSPLLHPNRLSREMAAGSPSRSRLTARTCIIHHRS
jgi:hypothetical protein